MKQSDERAPGRGGPPPSFGRDTGQPVEDFTVRGGQSFHLVLHVDVRPDAASLEALHTVIREATRAAVLDGYATAFAAMDSAEPPDGGDGATPPGGPDREGGAGGG